MAEKHYPTDDTWLGINIWSPFWPRLVLTINIVTIVAAIVAIVLGIMAAHG
jgi:hypothetical protein